jgi:hypothetical protein
MSNPTTLYRLNDGRLAVNVTENKTLADSDSGVVQNVITDGLTITLPATGLTFAFTVRNGGAAATGAPAGSAADGSCGITIAPNASDLIHGMQMTESDADTLTNTKATSKIGDEISLLPNGTDGWTITGMRGIWAQTAV